MEDVLQYEGKRVVVTGSASGMGAAAAQILTELGAEVIGLDVQATEANVKESIQVDLRDQASIDAAVEQIGGPVDSVFSVAGLPGDPFSDLDTMLVNVFGARHLIESLVPVIPAGGSVVCVASNAGLGWEDKLDRLLPPVQTPDFAAGKAWCEENPKAILGGYGPSKEMSNAWVAWRAPSMLEEHGIRLNLINPGPTQTAMMGKFEDQVGAAMIDAFVGPGGRRSSSEEQAWAMVFLNSPRSSFVAGEAFHVDAGFRAAMVTDQLKIG
jgi:NAD(P)-dependent dehydrogenase (short-subunit alcohol dehydrogenase family)